MATKVIYIVANWSTYAKEFQYSIQGYPPSTDNGYILVEERWIYFESMADAELRRQVSASLKGKQAKIMADAYVESKEIGEVIQEMLALEDKSNE